MLDLRYVLEHFDTVQQALSRRGPAAVSAIAKLAQLGSARKQRIGELEALQRERNQASDEMAKIADKKSDEFARRREVGKELGARVKDLEASVREIESACEDVLLNVPNLPSDDAPAGTSSDDNPVLRSWGEKPVFDFVAKDHVDVGEQLGIVDVAAGAKISGARFTVLRGAGARLERALISFMLDLHTGEHGYTEIWPPVVVKAESLRGTGQLPKFADDAFKLANTLREGENQNLELYLSPTAEVQLTNLHADEILEPEQMPRKYTAYSACFRAEAGSYGKDTRGLIRQHQFDKVEVVQMVAPEQALAAHQALTGHAEAVLQKLGLHYRVIDLCVGDLGFGAKRTFDLEVWLPGQNAYREISSCSWFGDFQARRAKIRFRAEKGGKAQLVHTLNGSGLAVGRTLVAILEQYQQADGSVKVPAALVPYMGGLERIVAA